MVVNVVALASFVVIAVVGVLPVAVVRVAVVAVVGNRASAQRRDMASSNFPSRSRSERELPPRRSRESFDFIYDDCCIIFLHFRYEDDFKATFEKILQKKTKVSIKSSLHHIMNL